MQGEVISQYVTLEQVDDAILRRYLNLVESANPEDLAKLLESWAKYISARRNSDVFEKGETESPLFHLSIEFFYHQNEQALRCLRSF